EPEKIIKMKEDAETNLWRFQQLSSCWTKIHSDHIFQNDNASAERLSLQDHLDHICEEVRSLYSKLRDMKSSITHQVSAKIKSSLPALVTTTL
ncbi:hypothetical protein Tco_0197667, partial [Tanacetum coccineum]